MPIYEYQCEKCEHQFDTLQNISDKPLKKCPECGKMSLTKLISAAGFRLKGSGWYETDFKSGNKKNLANSDGAAPKESKASSGGDSGTSGSSATKSADSGSTKAANSGDSKKSTTPKKGS